jgi:hypothetical protein
MIEKLSLVADWAAVYRFVSLGAFIAIVENQYPGTSNNLLKLHAFVSL